MLPGSIRRLWVIIAIISLTVVNHRAEADGDRKPIQAAAAVDFNRHIRAVLSENCFACHGPDEKTRKAKLRLDTKEGVFAKLRSGGFAIVPGKVNDSELIRRLTTHDEAELMPPPKTGKKLTAQQISLFKQWVEQGARWSSHWSFVAPKKPALPKVANGAWSRNPVDRFILARLQAAGLTPSSEADQTTLIRRVTLDLTGLPPTPAEVDAFLADPSPNAYEKVVDRLLASPRYGEHMTRHWLDAARYGDTHGLHLDNYREIWPYRDWVIQAFNKNMPFDRFIVEQLAGDLLPNATLQQQVATGFIRCHVTTSEGGSIDEEVYVRNVVDRVDTNGMVFMGLSIGCARCHDHRYDPISMKDYYQVFAFFNNLDGSPLDGNVARHPPVVKAPTKEQADKLAKLDQRIDAVNKQVAAALATVTYEEPKSPGEQGELRGHADFIWLDDSLPRGAKQVADGGVNLPWNFVAKPALHGAKSVKLSAKGLQQVVLESASPGLKVGQGDKLFAHVYIDSANPPREIMLQWHTSGWLHRAYWGENLIPWGAENSGERFKAGPLPKKGEWIRLEVEAAKVGIQPGAVINGFAFTQFDGVAYWDKTGLVTRTPQDGSAFDTLTAWLQMQRGIGGKGLPKRLEDLAKQNPAKHTVEQRKQLRDYFLQYAYSKTRTTFAALNEQLAKVAKERDNLDKQIPTTLVYRERNDQRPAYILKRGEYDQRGDKVERNTPAFLPPLPAEAPRNRLGFATWLTDQSHPLTARVAVNRLWQQVFGVGLVKTAEDFGSQGEPPSHLELLDFLAVQFREDGWDAKAMMKRLVTSATYRQSAKLTKDRLAKDPHNRLLSRGPRYRLDAEMLRDQALFVSGLLVEKVGGPSTKPPQPSGLWEAVAFTGSNTGIFKADTGPDKVHRRSMYIFWKRTAAPPQMNALDAPSRESCTVRRERTNMPLQALLLMNEVQFVESARVLAQRTLRDGGKTTDDRLKHLFRLATSRMPDARELGELESLLADCTNTFKGNLKGAQQLIAVGETRPDATLNPQELAAWTMLANLVLNLDEVITRG